HQNSDGTFTDVATDLGVALNGHYVGAAFADVDRDGYLDLMVAGTLRHTNDDLLPADEFCPAVHSAKSVAELLDAESVVPNDPSALFINGGSANGWKFTDQAAIRGVPLGGATARTRKGYGYVT